MMLMRNAAVIGLLLAGLGVTGAAAQHNQDDERRVGQKVTFTACVERGEKGDAFVLTDVADVPVHPASHGRVVYWINDVKALRGHVGHQIRVQATITDVDRSEMEVKTGSDSAGGMRVEVEGSGRDVRTDAAKAGVSGSGRAHDVKTTLVKVKVDEVVMTAASCQR